MQARHFTACYKLVPPNCTFLWLQARELADVRQKVETTELNSASPSRFTGYGRPTQLHANETSVSNSSSLHRMKSVDGRQIGKNSRNEVLLQHRSHIEQYKLRCEELRRVVESVKEMQKLLRSQVSCTDTVSVCLLCIHTCLSIGINPLVFLVFNIVVLCW